MSLIFPTFVFFIVFFRIPIFFTGIYFSLIIGSFSLIYLTKKNGHRFFFNALKLPVLILIFFIFTYSFAYDVVSGAIIKNPLNSFVARAIVVVFMSILPAFFLVWVFIRSNKIKLNLIIWWGFFLQLLFWLITFFIPGGKDWIYAIMAMTDSVNLTMPDNYFSRGFGYTTEVNYTSPFVMVLTIITVLGMSRLSILTVFTQIWNSNNVAVAFIFGLLARMANINLTRLVTYLMFIFIVILTYPLMEFFDFAPRLQAELASGGTRTIQSLLDNHFKFTNSNLLEFWFGTANYVFQGGHQIDIDVGWVILFNYGGLIFTACFLLLLIFICFLAFNSRLVACAWLIAGCALNTKGLLLSPNAYLFTLFLFLFSRRYIIIDEQSKSCDPK